MAVDTPTPGETVTPEAPSNEAKPTSTPAPVVSNASDNAEVERLKKELEQKELRNRQLENEAKARTDKEEADKLKQLEEDNNYKELLEQERAKREALEAEKSEKETKDEVDKAKSEALSGFSEEVKKLAEEVGIELTEADDAAVEKFKGKLEKISERVSSEARVTPNNPNQPENKMDLTTEQLQQGLQDDKSFHDIVTAKYPGIAAMTSKPPVAK